MVAIPPRFRSKPLGTVATRIVGAAALALALLVSLTLDAPREWLATRLFDHYQRIMPRVAADPPVAVVEIDEEALRSIGQWPWPRATIADLVDRLGDLGAAVVGFDVVFSEEDRVSLEAARRALEAAGARVEFMGGDVEDGDARLAAAFARTPVVLGLILSPSGPEPAPEAKAGFAFTGADPATYLPNEPRAVVNLEILRAAADGLGVFSLRPGLDGLVRQVPLVYQSGDVRLPSLALESLRIAQGASTIMLRGTGSSGEADSGAPAMTELKVGHFEVPTGPDGSVWVHYSGLEGVPIVSAARILDARGPPPDLDLQGRIVLVGSSAAGLLDQVATPLAANLPGVRVHADIVASIIERKFLSRPDFVQGAELFAGLLAGALVVLSIPYLRPLGAALLTVFLVALGLAASRLAFAQWGFLFDPLTPALILVFVYFATVLGSYLASDRERREVRRAFSQYLAPALVERLAEQPAQLKLGGEEKELTVLFADIRGFTSLSEGRSPTDLTDLLNTFLTPMTDCLLRSDATLDKYIGDAIMAFWNAPLDIADHRRHGCLCALSMRRALAALNAQGGTAIGMGVGLHAGLACVGNLGSKQRFSYSAIGDTVNVTARVEGLTKTYGAEILITGDVAEAVRDLAVLELDRVGVVGRKAPVTIHALLGDAADRQSDAFTRLEKAQHAFLAAYRAGNWRAASERLQALSDQAQGRLDTYVALMAARLDALTAAPPTDWDGVTVMREK